MKLKFIVIITDLMILILLLPAYKEIMDELVAIVESTINTPLEPFEAFVLRGLPIIYLVASLFWIGWGIYRSRNRGGMRF